MEKEFIFANDNLESFVNKIEAVFYESFDLDHKEMTEHDDHILLCLHFTGQQMMEDVIDEMEHKFMTKILYATRTVNGSEYYAVAYSEPYEDKMYVLFLNSNEYGIANFMVVRFYDSIDVIFSELMRLWSKRVNLGVTLEVTTRMNLIKDFL